MLVYVVTIAVCEELLGVLLGELLGLLELELVLSSVGRPGGSGVADPEELNVVVTVTVAVSAEEDGVLDELGLLDGDPVTVARGRVVVVTDPPTVTPIASQFQIDKRNNSTRIHLTANAHACIVRYATTSIVTVRTTAVSRTGVAT